MSVGEPIAFSVVTGFLGAGKTTLINRLLRSDAMSGTLVMVNEWGEIGLDHLLYERLAGDAVLIASGCVCCALRGDLVDALQSALARRDAGDLPPFGRIVLETSGPAEPGPILQAIAADRSLAARLGAATVTTLVDGVNGLATLGRHAESERQVALADRIVITKSDAFAPQQWADRGRELEAALRELNPLAPIFDCASGEFGPADLVASGAPPSRFSTSAASHAQGRAIATFAFRTGEPIDPIALERFLALLSGRVGPRLLRVKGLVALSSEAEAPVLIEAVQHFVRPPRRLARWPDAERTTRIVVIVEREAAKDVETLWAGLIRAPRPDTPDLAALADNPLAPRAGGLLS